MRQFVSASMPDKRGLIFLSTKDCHYFLHVLRLKAGDSIDVRLPDQKLVSMELRRVNLKGFSSGGYCLKIKTNIEMLAEQSCQDAFLPIRLFQFLPKAQKMDLIIRQAVECGVADIIPILGEYSEAEAVSAERLQRWERIMREARQQSGSPLPPRLSLPLSPAEAAHLWQKTAEKEAKGERTAVAFLLQEQKEGSQSLFSVLAQIPLPYSAALAVGSEGGMSPPESELLKKSGFIPIHFKTNILRSETAALYGIAAIQSAITECSVWKSKE